MTTPDQKAPAEPRLSPESADATPLLDRAHLARQTLGDAGLQAELLGLFRTQAERILADLLSDGGATAAKSDLAHKLTGSARAVGAARVAAAAEAYGGAAGEGGAAAAMRLRALAAVVQETLSVIEPGRDG